MKGEVIITTHGEYSDYSIVAVLRWASETTPEEARDEWIALPEQRRESENILDHYKFIAWLVYKGYAADLECHELYLSWRGYGSFSGWDRHPFKGDSHERDRS